MSGGAGGDPMVELREASARMAAAGEWESLVRYVEAADDPSLLDRDASLAYRYGQALYHTGRMESLAALAGRLEETASRRADGRGLLRALNLGAIAAFELGRIDSARSLSERQLALADAEDDEDMLARASQNLGAIAGLEGRGDEAATTFELAVPIYERLGRMRGLAQIRHNIGNCYRDAGRLGDAGDAYRDAERLYSGARDAAGVAMATTGRAEATILSGDPELGGRFAERGLALARAAGDPISEAEALRVRALAARRSGRSEGMAAQDGARGSAAARDLAAALRLARHTGNLLLQAEIERDAGRLRIETGRPDRARAPLRRALARFERLGAADQARKVRERLESVG